MCLPKSDTIRTTAQTQNYHSAPLLDYLQTNFLCSYVWYLTVNNGWKVENTILFLCTQLTYPMYITSWNKIKEYWKVLHIPTLFINQLIVSEKGKPIFFLHTRQLFYASKWEKKLKLKFCSNDILGICD